MRFAPARRFGTCFTHAWFSPPGIPEICPTYMWLAPPERFGTLYSHTVLPTWNTWNLPYLLHAVCSIWKLLELPLLIAVATEYTSSTNYSLKPWLLSEWTSESLHLSGFPDIESPGVAHATSVKPVFKISINTSRVSTQTMSWSTIPTFMIWGSSRWMVLCVYSLPEALQKLCLICSMLGMDIFWILSNEWHRHMLGGIAVKSPWGKMITTRSSRGTVPA